jgi:hypothetical protein
MMMAAIHQLAKFYLLFAEENRSMSTALLEEFESVLNERQEMHRERFSVTFLPIVSVVLLFSNGLVIMKI